MRLSLSYWILQALDYLAHLFGNYGWGIIALSVLLSLATAPIQHMQLVNQGKTQEFDRLRKELEKRYKGDKERIQEETVRLMRSEKFSPLQGCLPMIIQIILIFAFFGALRSLTYAGDPGFFWIKDLSKPDLYVLPALAGVTTYLRSKLTTPTAASADSSMKTQQTLMLYGMPVFVAYMSMKLAAGLSIYWVVANVFSIGQQLVYPAGRRGRGVPAGAKQPAAGQTPSEGRGSLPDQPPVGERAGRVEPNQPETKGTVSSDQGGPEAAASASRRDEPIRVRPKRQTSRKDSRSKSKRKGNTA